MSSFSQLVADVFQPDSRLAQNLGGYQFREQQQVLAGEIAEAMDQGHILLSEAETGIGKTLAYLIPSLLTSDKVLISTHTKALQDQLMFRDIPGVQQALGATRRIALLKGRSNYLCPVRMEMHLTSGQLEMWAQKPLLQVMEWSETSADGDLSGLPFDVFAKGIGPMVTATAEQCTGSKCAEFDRCPLMKARQKAQAADIVITNHSLLMADAALKSGDFGEVLPDFDNYVLDEAHALPDVAAQHFGVQLGRNRFLVWLNDMQAELELLADEYEFKQQLVKQGSELVDIYQKSDMEALSQCWQVIVEGAQARAERSETMAKLHERAVMIANDLQSVIKPDQGFVGWTEGEGDQRRHIVAPVETGPLLHAHLWERPAAYVLLSATLSVSGHFDYSRARLGVGKDAVESRHRSPFDYARQAVAYLPNRLPDPRSPNAEYAMLAEMETLLRASRGRAFVLFTSWAALNRMATELAERLPWPVLIQGKDGSRDAILAAFREDTHSILCGTRSFWEGVDVPGESLSMVIIDKIPFASPNDALLQARIRKCEEEGGNGFMDIQLPEAIATLRQGVGRLIRKSTDIGVIAVLDSRLHSKRYGREIIRNLPPAKKTVDLAEVRWFYEAHEDQL